MKRRVLLPSLLAMFFWAAPAKADTAVIVRITNLPALQTLCALPATCTIAATIDGTLGQVFLVTTPLPLQTFLTLLSPLTGFVGAEVDQALTLLGGLNVVPTPIDLTLLSDRTPVVYPPGAATMAWNSYVNQPAAGVVEVQTAQSQFKVTGSGIVADIDTGVDPNHPALQGVLLEGYDFTRNQPGGSEMNDLSPSFTSPTPCDATTCPQPVQVNQSTAAVLDQSTAAVLDTNSQYAAFGHGTLVMGIVHLVAPTAQLLPLKAFKSDGTAQLSDILRAIYYAVQQGNANVINMSFDMKSSSTELKNALDYANQLGLTCVASSGNDGAQEVVYPAALQADVMGVGSVGSTSATDTVRSSFSNFGSAIVWVAAPGEEIISTYPFSSYAAGWGTSFSAPFVSGGVALLRSLKTAITESESASAVASSAPLDPSLGMNHGRLDLVPALQSLSVGAATPDYTVSAAPANQTITAGQSVNFTVSAAPVQGFKQTITWSCSGAPAGAACSISPSTLTLDGTHAATATVSVTTTARGSGLPLFLPPKPAPPPIPWTIWAAWLAAFALLLRLRGLVRASRRFALAPGLLAVLLLLNSCGGSYSNPPGTPGAPTLYSMTLSPSSVTAGASSAGTVTLSAAAPSGGAAIQLSSSVAAASVPASVTVPAGTASTMFTVTTNSVTASTNATITGSYGGVSKTAMLTVTPASSGGTPAGAYTLTITGTSGNLAHSTSVQLTVN